MPLQSPFPPTPAIPSQPAFQPQPPPAPPPGAPPAAPPLQASPGSPIGYPQSVAPGRVSVPAAPQTPPPAVRRFAEQTFAHGAPFAGGTPFGVLAQPAAQPQLQPQPQPQPPMLHQMAPQPQPPQLPQPMPMPPGAPPFQMQPQLQPPLAPMPMPMPGQPPLTQPPSTDAALVDAIKNQSAAFTQALEEQRTALAQIASPSGAGGGDTQQIHEQKVAAWQTARQTAIDAAALKFQEQAGAGNYADAVKNYQQALEKLPAQPQQQAQQGKVEENVFLRSMQSDALGRSAERDPFLHQQYGKQIREELNKLTPELRFTSEGVQQAEALVRGQHFNELMQYNQQQQQWAAYQQQQYQQQQHTMIPPQSLPRPDFGENQQTNLYNLPAEARQVAYQMGLPLDEYARYHAQFHGYGTLDGQPASGQQFDRSVGSLEGAEGIAFIPEGEEAALQHQQQAAAWHAMQQQQQAMFGGGNPYYWQPGVPNAPQAPPQMQPAPQPAYPPGYGVPFQSAA